MKFRSVVILIVFLALSSTIIAQPKGRPGRMMERDQRPMRMMENLNLTEQQQSKIDDLRFENKNQAIDLRAELQKNRLEMRKMIKDNKIDKKQFMALTEKNSAIQAKLKSSKVEMFLKIYDLLDENQKEIFSDEFGGFNGPDCINCFDRGGRKGLRGQRFMNDDLRDDAPGRPIQE